MNYQLTIHPAFSGDAPQPRLTWTVPEVFLDASPGALIGAGGIVLITIQGYNPVPAGNVFALFEMSGSEVVFTERCRSDNSPQGGYSFELSVGSVRFRAPFNVFLDEPHYYYVTLTDTVNQTVMKSQTNSFVNPEGP